MENKTVTGTQVDYFLIDDRFEKCKDVKSRLVYGDESVICNPWITVVVPTYRRPHQLKDALTSILTQHVTEFNWDVVVVDNEPDDLCENDTERLIREINNPRILYYRNSENIWVGDNFNRCILLARGKWVVMLHDDDMLIANALNIIGALINRYDLPDRPLGAIAASYIQVRYNPITDKIEDDIESMNRYYSNVPINYEVYQLTNNNVKALSHVGGSAPTNGTTFRREAMLKIGGFNKDYGISGDLIIFYKLEQLYSVYQTMLPLGFYRWGMNSMMEKESLRKVIKDNYDFREYLYKQSLGNRIIGLLFRKCHYKRFSNFAINERVMISGENISLEEFNDIYEERPNVIWYCFYILIEKIYAKHKYLQMKKNVRKTFKSKNK